MDNRLSRTYSYDIDAAVQRFWLGVIGGIAAGVLLGVYIIPTGSVPSVKLPFNTQPYSEAEQAAMIEEEIISQHHALEAALTNAVEEANTRSSVVLEVRYATPALVYTMYSPDTGECGDFLLMPVGDSVHSQALSPPHPC